MKSNKGVTLTSLTIYIIGVVIIIAAFTTFSDFFYTNVNHATAQDNYEEQYARLTTFLTKDVNSGSVNIISSSNNGQNDYISIKFNSGIIHQYIYTKEKIFYLEIKNGETTKKIELCGKVNFLSNRKVFSYDSAKRQININCSINEKNYSDVYFVK